jgi:hypothetical protein
MHRQIVTGRRDHNGSACDQAGDGLIGGIRVFSTQRHVTTAGNWRFARSSPIRRSKSLIGAEALHGSTRTENSRTLFATP